MKKSNFWALGLIALMLAAGLVLASCNYSYCPGVTSGHNRGMCNYITTGFYSDNGRKQECEYGCITAQISIKDKKSDLSCDCRSYIKENS